MTTCTMRRSSSAYRVSGYEEEGRRSNASYNCETKEGEADIANRAIRKRKRLQMRVFVADSDSDSEGSQKAKAVKREEEDDAGQRRRTHAGRKVGSCGAG